MKAIRVKEFGGPEVLRLEEVPTLQPGPGQVLVRMHAIGINPVETYIRAGTYARLPELPYTPGNDGAGVVEKVGQDVNEFKAGEHEFVRAESPQHFRILRDRAQQRNRACSQPCGCSSPGAHL